MKKQSDAFETQEIMKQITTVLEEIDNKTQNIQNHRDLLDVANSFTNLDFELVAMSRVMVSKNEIKYKNKNYRLFLFSDLYIMAKPVEQKKQTI